MYFFFKFVIDLSVLKDVCISGGREKSQQLTNTDIRELRQAEFNKFLQELTRKKVGKTSFTMLYILNSS